MIASRVIAALAVVGIAAAQSACSATGTATITNAAQATQYAGCKKIAGSILIAPEAIGPISFDGPSEISGSVVALNAGELTTLGSSTVTSIGKTFQLGNLTKLSGLNWPVLEEVNKINWIALPVLSVLGFTANVTKADDVVIGNTFISSLNGINLAQVKTLDISNNNRLKLFTADLVNVTESLVIGNNGQLLQVSFPDLKFAANMTFRNISSVDLPSLSVVTGSLGFYGNFLTAVAAPKLTTVGDFPSGQGSLAFVANSKLTEIDVPVLTSVGGAFQIANNTALSSIDFPALESVGGAVDFSGSFETPKLAKIKDVRGGFNMQSTKTIDCSGFQSLRQSSAIQGVFTCKGALKDATSADGTTTSGDGTSTSSATPSKSAGPASSYGVNSAVAGVSVFGGLLAMLL